MSKQIQIFLGLLALAMPVHGEPLGRLFFTPEQRAALDQQRHLNLKTEGKTGADRTMVIDGKVRRSSGRHTTWINGQPINETPPLAEPLGSLKVGETIHLESGKRTDLLKDGKLAISHPPRIPPQ